MSAPEVPAKWPNAEWQFRCEMCGEKVDEDHCYCVRCGDHAGSWELVDEHEEPIDTANYGPEAFEELIRVGNLLVKHLAEVCDDPCMQTKVDEYGNEAARIVRSGTRVSLQAFKDVLRRAATKPAE